MVKKLFLQNFRNYTKREFGFGPGTTLIVGPNASGKTNILEAIYALAIGKSFRAENEREVIREGSAFAKASADEGRLEIFWEDKNYNNCRFYKHYKVNGVGKRQQDFVGNLRAVLFSPQDIEIVTDSPAARRRYLDLVLTQIFKDYREAARVYERALRQRNRLLWMIREGPRFAPMSIGASRGEQLEYWDNLLIANGAVIHERRREFLSFLSSLRHLSDPKGGLPPIFLEYGHSVVSAERLEKYREEEVAAAATLVGPHRDDFTIKIRGDQTIDDRYEIKDKKIEDGEWREAKIYGSRGEQRLAMFTIKMGEREYIRSQSGSDPVLLLDDIFSELDSENRRRILAIVPRQQTIITTTDLHLVDRKLRQEAGVLSLAGEKR